MNKTGVINISVSSEYDQLENVIIHTPGPEVENMTPINAERALYSDILNLSAISKEYEQFKSILKMHSEVFEVKNLLFDILHEEKTKEHLISKICNNENVMCIKDYLMNLDPKNLARAIIEGVELERDNLTKFLSSERYSLNPLHNFFFTRDASVVINENIFIGKMANIVREREAIIMESIFNFHEKFQTITYNPLNENKVNGKITIEGGDILIAGKDVLLVGNSSRTSSEGIDYILEKIKSQDERKHIIVQELPHSPESFIHLDMTFTFLSENEALIYSPVILELNKYRTIHMEVYKNQVKIHEEKNIPDALTKLGFEIEVISCGGKNDLWIQEREQWHSGANLFALAPSKLIAYDRNVHTLEELNKHGYEIIKALELIKGRKKTQDYKKYVVTIDSSELSRGGGGCRCMTMPLTRNSV